MKKGANDVPMLVSPFTRKRTHTSAAGARPLQLTTLIGWCGARDEMFSVALRRPSGLHESSWMEVR